MEQAVFKQFSRLDSIVPPDSFILTGALTHHLLFVIVLKYFRY